jgi:hypothetical protein
MDAHSLGSDVAERQVGIGRNLRDPSAEGSLRVGRKSGDDQGCNDESANNLKSHRGARYFDALWGRIHRAGALPDSLRSHGRPRGPPSFAAVFVPRVGAVVGDTRARSIALRSQAPMRDFAGMAARCRAISRHMPGSTRAIRSEAMQACSCSPRVFPAECGVAAGC